MTRGSHQDVGEYADARWLALSVLIGLSRKTPDGTSDGYVGGHEANRRVINAECTIPEYGGVSRGMRLFDRVAADPTRANDVHEVRIRGEECRELVHVMFVPRGLESTYDGLHAGFIVRLN